MTSWNGALIAAVVLLLNACGGGGGGDDTPPPPAQSSYTLGGSVTGLIGTLQLQLAANGVVIGTQNLTANGAFTLTSTLSSGQSYALTVLSQPSGQTCAITNGNGVVGSSNITNVSIVCVSGGRTVGGSVSGLTGTVVLRLTVGGVVSGNDLSVSSNGSFTFGQALISGQTYVVSVQTQPTGQTCTVSNGTGTIGSFNVTNVAVACTTNVNVLSCPSTDGTNVGGLGFSGSASYSGLTSAASTFDSSITVGYGITYSNSSLSASSFTGSIRIGLWAVSSSFTGGTISGTRIARFTPNFTGPGARSSDQLYNFSTVSNATSIGSGTTPARGTYCIVMTLDEYDPANCTSSDGYCYTDYRQFSGSVTFN